MPCIGEQLKDRDANKTDEVCFNQMKAISGTVQGGPKIGTFCWYAFNFIKY